MGKKRATAKTGRALPASVVVMQGIRFSNAAGLHKLAHQKARGTANRRAISESRDS